MSFFLSKKVLIPVSLLTVSTVAVGIGTSINANNYENTQNQKADINTFISKLDSSSIVFKSNLTRNNLAEEEQISISDVYAFSLDPSDISLNKTISIPDEIKVDFKLKNEINNSTSLNNGVLKVEILVSNEKETVSKVIELNGFKKSNKLENSIVENIEQKNQISFSIKNRKVKVPNWNGSEGNVQYEEKTVDFVSIEQLNALSNEIGVENEEINNLTYWLRNNSNLSSSKKDLLKNLTIKGNVKLERISKQNDTVYFYLTSANNQHPLIAITKDEKGNVINEYAIDEIKTTNLLATDVTLTPLSIDQEKTEIFKTALKSLPEEDNKFLSDRVDKNLEREISLPSFPGISGNDRLFFKTYSVETQPKIPTSIKISFGSGEYVKTYDTSNLKDAQELSDAGFKFQAYGKEFLFNRNYIQPFQLYWMGETFAKFFADTNYYIPIEKTKDGIDKSESNGKFNVYEYQKGAVKNFIDIDTKYRKRAELTIWMFFANYTYDAIVKDQVLFTPSITLISVYNNNPSDLFGEE